MIDVKFREKLQQLKARFIDGDDSAKQQINQWEADIQRLSLISDFVAQPIVQHITMILKDRLKAIILEKMKEGRSDTLDAREKEIRYCLSLFMPKYESELQSIESIIDQELL